MYLDFGKHLNVLINKYFKVGDEGKYQNALTNLENVELKLAGDNK